MKKWAVSILIFLIAVVLLGILLFSKNDLEQSFIGENRISDLPEQADILFVSNKDTGDRRTEIYSMGSDGENQERLTFTNEHHFIMGTYNKKYLLASRSEKDTQKPKGLGDEDKRSLWLIDLESKRETRLTPLENNAEGDSFSPDGKWIVFMMTVKGEQQADIYKIRTDGSELTKLTDTKTSVEGDPEFSPDGKKIIFASLDGLDENPRFMLKKMDIDGSNVETVYDGGEGFFIGPFPPGNFDPSLSPDNKKIVFERAVSDKGNFGSGRWHIFSINLDGSELVDLSEKGGHEDKAEYLPSYSPDGKWIVFGSIYEAKNPEESFSDIFKMNSGTGELVRLTYNLDNKYPVWIN